MLGKRIGPYLIQEELGRGGMATVYRAHQVTVDRAVAMKILHVHIGYNETAVARFMSEARVIARLEHPHILPIYDFDGKHEPPYLVMRYMPSGTLKEAVERTALPHGEILYMYNQIASALDYAHRNDVVHRDIKPSNIMLDSEGNAFITDFGIARMISDEQGLTQSGTAVGTPGYMAPEQGLGQDIDGRADVYSLGVMLYELLTGTAPYVATTPMAVLMRHLNDPIPSILEHDPEFSAQLQAVIEKALAKKPDERYQTASEMVLAMRPALGGEIKSRPVKLQEAATMAMEEADERTSAFVEIHPTDSGRRDTAETDMSLETEAATAGSGHQYVPTERAPAYPPPRSELPAPRRSGRLTYGIAGAAALLVVIAIIAGILLLTSDDGGDDEGGVDEQAGAATETGAALAVSETAIALAADLTATPSEEPTETEEATEEASATTEPTDTEEPTQESSETPTDQPSDTPDPTATPTNSPTAPPTDTEEPSATPTSPDTDTPQPTETDTFTPSATHTPSTPQALVNTTTTQVRLGPGNEYPQVDFLTVDSPVEIIEISADGLWVRVNYASFDGEQGSGFVRTRDLDLTGGTMDDLAAASFPTLTYTPTDTPTEAVSDTPSPTPTQTPSNTPTQTVSPTPSEEPTATATHTPSGTPTDTPTPTTTPTELPNIVSSELGDNAGPVDECLYEFEFGDTLFGIAMANELTVEELLEANPEVNPNNIAPGTEILVPDCGPEPPPLMSVVEGDILTGHATGVNDTAVSPSGTRMASAGGDGTIRIYDTANNEVIHILRDHEDEVNAVAFSPDSRTLASASEDGTVRMWDVATGNLIVTLTDHNAPVNDVAFRPDGVRAVSGGDDNRVRIWEVVSNRWLLQHAIPYTVPVTAVTYSPDGSTIGAGLADGDVKIVNRVQGGDFTLVGHNAAVTAVLFADADTLVSASRSGTIRNWRVRLINPYGEEDAVLQRHTDAVNALSLDTTRTLLASGGSDRTIWLWHLPSASEIVAVVDGHSSDVYGVAFHPTGRRLVSGGQDSTVRTWQINLGGVLERVIYTGPVTDVAYARDGLKIATASENGVAVWDTDSSALLFIPEEGEQPMLDVAFSPDSQRLAGAGQDRTVYLWDAAGQLLNTFSGHSLEVMSVAFSPDGALLASGGADNTVRLWSVTDGSEAGTLSGHSGGVLGLAFSPDGRTLAAAAGDGNVTLWDISTLAERAVALRGASDAMLSVAFSPDGAQLAAASEDTTVRVWDLETGEVLHLLESHRADAYAVAYGANGMLVSAGLDGDIIRWNLAEDEPLLTISGHTAAVTDLAFNANGILLASASPDGTVRLWEMPRQ